MELSVEEVHAVTTFGWAARDQSGILSPFKFSRRSMTGRKLVGGSTIGGLKETQEMIDFATKHNITADTEVISMDYMNTAMERLEKVDVKYRFVIDVANTLKAA